MKITNNRPNMSSIDYKDYIKYLIDQGYYRVQLNIDEKSEIVTTRSLAQGATGTVIDIRCPSSRKIIIAGREQSSENVHKLVVRIANKDDIEIAPDTRIKIIKEKVSEAITLVATMFYKDITVTEYLKTNDSNNGVKTYEEFYMFNQGIEINGEEHLKIDVVNPDINIDSGHVKLGLDIDLFEEY